MAAQPPDGSPSDKPTAEQLEYAEMLLEHAGSDLAAAQVLAARDDMRDDVVGFHCQQAVEKALKVGLVLADVDFPRSHDLRELTDIAKENDVTVPASVEEARWLTPWAAQLRYDMLEPLDRDAAIKPAFDAVEWATGLLAEWSTDEANAEVRDEPPTRDEQ